jgi:pSer/pThr/pTyr-binding forkhead associated (FHA) protein
VSFAKRAKAELSGEPSLPHEPSAFPTVACALCGSLNQRHLRFCITCGQALVIEDEGGPTRVGAAELMRTLVDATKPEPAQWPPSGAPPIAPARVIDVGPAPASPRSAQRLCPRCRGICDPGTQFCRFCGLSLAGTAAAITAGGAAATPRTSSRSSPASSSVHASLAPGRLVLITRDGGEGPSYALGESTDLGRVEGDILFPEDQYISPRHARVVSRGGAFFVLDLESTNGVYARVPFGLPDDDPGERQHDKITVRGQHSSPPTEARAEQPLVDQEMFLVGQQVLRFELVKQAEEGFGAASENGTLVFGTPAAPRYARLSQRTVEGVVRDVFHLRRAETVIGRESGDIVFTDDPFLSRRHAALRMYDSAGGTRRFALADLGSSNGTFLRIRNEVRLRYGDHFRIGQQLLRFDFDAARAGT